MILHSTTTRNNELLLGLAIGATSTAVFLKTIPSFRKLQMDTDPRPKSNGRKLLTKTLELIERKWGLGGHNKEDSVAEDHKDPTSLQSKVINYKDPDELKEELEKVAPISIQEEGMDCSQNSDQTMFEMFKTFSVHSVNTSHPLFVNQLFGTLDRAAMAAEFLSTADNTSNYTYEAAPVYSLLEKEVLIALCDTIGWNYENECDGMMAPGGSIANITAMHCARHHKFPSTLQHGNAAIEKKPVAFVAEEAHYSFLKCCGLLGLGRNSLVKVATDTNGAMDVSALRSAIAKVKKEGGTPFFIGCTAGSTVRGSFDPFVEVAAIGKANDMWVHVDGAWGGNAIFSSRQDMKNLMAGVAACDSFTCNPHKMLGAPLQTTCFVIHKKNFLHEVNSSKAQYIFDERKANAHLDVGDKTFMCGRKTDALKFWALWRFRGKKGLNDRVNGYVDQQKILAEKIRKHPSFMLACEPWPFNLNFFFIPKRIKAMLEAAGISTDGSTYALPDDISAELDAVSVTLKLLMQKAGKALMPYQPLSTQKAQCFRVVISGEKDFNDEVSTAMMDYMLEYGDDL